AHYTLQRRWTEQRRLPGITVRNRKRCAKYWVSIRIIQNTSAMHFHLDDIFLLYNLRTSAGEQTKSAAMTLSNHINEIDALQQRLGPTYWKEVINMLGIIPKRLLDKSHPDYQAKVRGNAYTMNGWLDVLIHNPQLLKAPIAIYNGRAILCQK